MRPPHPVDAATLPQIGTVGLLRWAWRQLTSMRTALFLLMLLAIAAVPGSVVPQRGIDPVAVARYLDDHESAGPWLDRLGFFDVYSSPWFSAIYLLLFVSLVGCVLPRTRVHLGAVRARPPRTPARLERLPAHRSVAVDAGVDDVLRAAGEILRRRRYRTEPYGGSVRRARLPPGDRQPPLPRLAPGASRRRRAGWPVRLPRAGHRAGRAGVRELPRQVRHVRPRGVVRPG